nr:MAG TPA: hypothetical protein [Caudoviricetes sp.]
MLSETTKKGCILILLLQIFRTLYFNTFFQKNIIHYIF